MIIKHRYIIYPTNKPPFHLPDASQDIDRGRSATPIGKSRSFKK
jgi:hypothetical protein